ncbi:hexamerin-1.1-like [Bradysia coprophila]|uniref:hexamerin-1.1-like n=1 Tax=Bradysia coprophila TaxID=38358 RepID=UPI00187DC526|nr:hexamerin-1.1-like [Bradysia coprophila]
MKLIAVFIVACAVASASGAVHKFVKTPTKFVDETFLVKQKAILDLLQHVHQKDIYTEGKWLTDKEFFSYDYDYNTKFTNVEAVMEFLNFYRTGMLPRGEVFSIMNEMHRRQVIALFHLFYYAKDWESFYQVATFARLHVNEGMFIYALTVAVLHRKDMTGMVLPPPYEVYPFYFFNYDVVRKAQQYKMQGFDKTIKTDKTYTVVIPSNYTDYLFETNMESKLSYFMEDIGLNTYYYYFHMDYPFWMTGKNYLTTTERRGELYLFKHQQILARYYLERLSLGMGTIPTFSWMENIRTGYYPALRYYNGEYFPMRDNFYNMYTEYNYFDLDIVTRYERRILDAIDLGYFTLYDGTKYELTKPENIDNLALLIKGFTDVEDIRFYGYLEYFAKMLLGTSMTTMNYHRTIPSVLEHFETSMRDPIFYQLYKRIINYYWSFKTHLPSYTTDDLLFDGVKIESVFVDKLVTFFDTFYSDITNVVDVEKFDDTYTKTDMYTFGRKAHYTGKDFVIKTKQLRLNHKPFNVRLNVLSNKAQRAVVKMFLGPKYNEFGFEYRNINENRENFVELEHFVVDLAAGMNTIDRNCQQFSKFIGDYTTYYDLYKDLMMSTKSEMKFAYDKYEKHCGFPWRLMLPKGTKGGMEFQMFFIVVPQIDIQTTMMRDEPMFICGNYDQYVDYRSYGFPLDRTINEMYWYTPNMYYYDAIIYHEETIDMMMF